MKICSQCGSPDVAQSVWMHMNTIGIAPMDSTFYWCFDCGKDTVIIDKSSSVLENKVVVKTQIDQKPSELTITSVSAHFRETPVNHQSSRLPVRTPLQINYHTDEWKWGGCMVRYWTLIKNAKKAETKGMKVDWKDEKDGKVPVWHRLEEKTAKRRKK